MSRQYLTGYFTSISPWSRLFHHYLASIQYLTAISPVSRRGLAYFTGPLYYLASILPPSHQISYHGKSPLSCNGLTQLTILQLSSNNFVREIALIHNYLAPRCAIHRNASVMPLSPLLAGLPGAERARPRAQNPGMGRQAWAAYGRSDAPR